MEQAVLDIGLGPEQQSQSLLEKLFDDAKSKLTINEYWQLEGYLKQPFRQSELQAMPGWTPARQKLALLAVNFFNSIRDGEEFRPLEVAAYLRAGGPAKVFDGVRYEKITQQSFALARLDEICFTATLCGDLPLANALEIAKIREQDKQLAVLDYLKKTDLLDCVPEEFALAVKFLIAKGFPKKPSLEGQQLRLFGTQIDSDPRLLVQMRALEQCRKSIQTSLNALAALGSKNAKAAFAACQLEVSIPDYNEHLASLRQQKILLGRKGKPSDAINKTLAEISEGKSLQRLNGAQAKQIVGEAAAILMPVLKQEAQKVIGPRTRKPKGPPILALVS